MSSKTVNLKKIRCRPLTLWVLMFVSFILSCSSRLTAQRDRIANLNQEQDSFYQRHQGEMRLLNQQPVQEGFTQFLPGILLCAGILIPTLFLFFYNERKRKEQALESLRQEKETEVRKAVHEACEQERRRIAADLHDQLGSYAAAISINASGIAKLAKTEAEKTAVSELNKNANAIVAQLNDTIWVLTRESLSFTAISDRLKVYVLHLQKSYRNFDCNFGEQIDTDHLFAPAPGFHLLKILQEGITNAFKHSKGSHVTIRFNSSATNWEIIIDDDGVGMLSEGEAAGGGNGVANMKKRAEEARMEIAWTTKADGGTRLTVKGKCSGRYTG